MYTKVQMLLFRMNKTYIYKNASREIDQEQSTDEKIYFKWTNFLEYTCKRPAPEDYAVVRLNKVNDNFYENIKSDWSSFKYDSNGKLPQYKKVWWYLKDSDTLYSFYIFNFDKRVVIKNDKRKAVKNI